MADPNPNALPDDWTFQLAQAFLDAAVSCGAVCDRRWVSDGGTVEQPPPNTGCRCQLVAVVTEGFGPMPGPFQQPPCGKRRLAAVRLVLDLCSTVAAQDQVPDPAKVSTQAQQNAATRWAIMRGLIRARQDGTLAKMGEPPATRHLLPGATGCGRIAPAPWQLTRTSGGVARWETTWTYQLDE